MRSWRRRVCQSLRGAELAARGQQEGSTCRQWRPPALEASEMEAGAMPASCGALRGPRKGPLGRHPDPARLLQWRPGDLARVDLHRPRPVSSCCNQAVSEALSLSAAGYTEGD